MNYKTNLSFYMHTWEPVNVTRWVSKRPNKFKMLPKKIIADALPDGKELQKCMDLQLTQK